MYKYVKQLMGLAVLVLAILFMLFVINQTAQIVNLAGSVNPVLGQVVLFVLLILYAAIIIVPVVWMAKMPRPLFPPVSTAGEEYREYITRLGHRLAKNPHLEGVSIVADDPASVEGALGVLNKKADERIKSAASNVFIMTAISQYGALDAIIVLIAQFRMVWQVTTLYNQRPTLRELIYLYTNVFATAFLASRIENLNLLEDQLEPVIASIMGSSLSSLTPAFSTAATVVTNSIIQGSANAFLTLRVGVITRMYCSSLTKQEKGQLRRAAAVQAASMLGKVLGESAYTVSRIVFKAAARAGKRPFRYGHDIITRTTKSTIKKSGEFVNDLTGTMKKRSGKFWVFSRKKLDEE